MKEKTKPKEVKLLQPKIDIVFQSLFNVKNKEITKSFVEALLEEKIVDRLSKIGEIRQK